MTTLLHLHRSLGRQYSLPQLSFARGIHQSALRPSQRRATHDRLVRDLGSDFKTSIVNIKDVISNLKILQAERTLKNHPDTKWLFSKEAAFYRDAIRDLTQAFPPSTHPSQEIPLASVAEALSDENAVAWRMLGNIVKDGKVPEVEKLSEEMRAAILFHTIHGIGGVKAKDLASLGYRTLDELKKNVHLLSKAQKLGLEHYDDLQTMIPRAEIDTFKDLFSKALEIDPEIKFEICGSYRRGNALSSDIDIVAWHPSYNDRDSGKGSTERLMELIWVALRNAGVTHEDKLLGKGAKKIMALTKLPEEGSLWRQVDIRLSTLDSLPYTMLALSGDDTLMKILRKTAKNNHGLTLNEYEMGERKPGMPNSTQAVEGTQILFKDERGIFDYLGVPYLEVTQRNYRTYSQILPRKFF